MRILNERATLQACVRACEREGGGGGEWGTNGRISECFIQRLVQMRVFKKRASESVRTGVRENREGTSERDDSAEC